MDLIDALQHYWLTIGLIGGFGLWMARNQWKQDRDQQDNNRRFKEGGDDLNSGLNAVRSEIATVRSDHVELKSQVQNQGLHEAEFKLVVTNKITAIETMLNGLSGLVGDVKSAIRDALKP